MIYIRSWNKIIDSLIYLSYSKNVGINYNGGVNHKGVSRDNSYEF